MIPARMSRGPSNQECLLGPERRAATEKSRSPQAVAPEAQGKSTAQGTAAGAGMAQGVIEDNQEQGGKGC